MTCLGTVFICDGKWLIFSLSCSAEPANIVARNATNNMLLGFTSNILSAASDDSAVKASVVEERWSFNYTHLKGKPLVSWAAKVVLSLLKVSIVCDIRFRSHIRVHSIIVSLRAPYHSLRGISWIASSNYASGLTGRFCISVEYIENCKRMRKLPFKCANHGWERKTKRFSWWLMPQGSITRLMHRISRVWNCVTWSNRIPG